MAAEMSALGELLEACTVLSALSAHVQSRTEVVTFFSESMRALEESNHGSHNVAAVTCGTKEHRIRSIRLACLTKK